MKERYEWIEQAVDGRREASKRRRQETGKDSCLRINEDLGGRNYDEQKEGKEEESG